jgi:NodT family efflux transporter outer membrane factor (OMF) lipoprotein
MPVDSRCLKLSKALVPFLWIVAAGCAVGPDYRPPPAPDVQTYTEKPTPAETVSAPGLGGAAQRFVDRGNIPAQWWTLFHSEALDQLIRRALADSPTLAAAEAALRQARENLRARTGTVAFPSVDGSFSAVRQKVTGAGNGLPEGAGSTFSLFNASVGVSYVLDVFGGGRRELEALRAQVDYQRFLLEGAHLTLASNIVTAAIREASLRGQIRANEEIVASELQQMEMVERQAALGGAAQSDVLAQQAQLAQSRAVLPVLERELGQTRNLLAVLSGSLPTDAALPEFRIEAFRLPVELPVSLPSSLVRQRPDIRASEELLHAASANVGVATANLYPQISLSASMGANALRIEDLFSAGTSLWSIGAGLLQPLFRGGELRAKRRAAIAAYDQALALYRETVLQAFQNVADVLQALEANARTLRAQADAEAIARDSLNLTEKQFHYGAANYLTLLNAQRQHQRALIILVQAQTARFADTAALFQALGGGWWGTEDNGAGQGLVVAEPFTRDEPPVERTSQEQE